MYLYAQEITNPLRVFGYRIDGDRLQPLPGSPWTTGGLATCNELCQAIAHSPRRRLLFAGGDQGIVVFHVGANGVLRCAPGGSPEPGPVHGLAVLESEDHAWIYATDRLRGEIRGYAARPDGSLGPVRPNQAMLACQPLDTAAVGKCLFVATWAGESISAYRAGADGSLQEAPGSPFRTAIPVTYISVALNGQFLYASCTTGAGCQRFRIDHSTGALTEHCVLGRPSSETVHRLAAAGFPESPARFLLASDGHEPRSTRNPARLSRPPVAPWRPHLLATAQAAASAPVQLFVVDLAKGTLTAAARARGPSRVNGLLFVAS